MPFFYRFFVPICALPFLERSNILPNALSLVNAFVYRFSETIKNTILYNDEQHSPVSRIISFNHYNNENISNHAQL